VNASGRPLIVLYAHDLPGPVKRVEDAGGKIVRPIYDFPGGRRFHFADPDGYELAVYTDVAEE
jgi:predicted enzyme related to lactoylglutathione lyase